MSQKLTQARARYLNREVTDRRLLSLVGSGLSFEEIAREIDPTGERAITGRFVMEYLTGAVRVNTGPYPDDDERVDWRRTQYLRLRELMHDERAGPVQRPC